MPRVRVQDRSRRICRRKFCLRLSNPTPQECVRWNAVITLGSDAPEATNLSFFIVQTEKGAETGTVHYQAYAEFKKRIEWSEVKRIFGERVKIINSIGGAGANIRYCSKDDTRFTEGDVCIRGSWGTAKRGGSDLLAAIRIQQGEKLEAIERAHPELCLKHMASVTSYIAHCKGVRTELPEIKIFYGVTGSGKSRHCLETYGSAAYWVAPPEGSRVWFGGYVCQDVCVFDDFHDGWFPLTMVLRLMDRYPVMVAPKGGQVPFNSKLMVFTSNVDPKDWYINYKGKREHKEALERRIKEYCQIYDCSKVDDEFRRVERDMTAFKFTERVDRWHAGGRSQSGRDGWNGYVVQ